MSDRVLRFTEAVAVVQEQAAKAAKAAKAATLRAETVELLGSVERVLAETIVADRDQPAFDRATRDGFAVHAGAISEGAVLRVVGQLRAGEGWNGEAVRPHEAVEIMTGAAMPEGADAVVMVEHVVPSEAGVGLSEGRRLRAGENIVARGREAVAGAVVVAMGATMGAAEIALAATCGRALLKVFVRPRVAIVATGDELVEVDETPSARQIRNSNSYALAALVAAAGGEPQRLKIARDEREELRERIREGRRAELLLLSGGVSMGKYDLVEELLAEAGAEFFFTGVKMQPGKPVVFGRLPETVGAAACYFFGLPGNPISAQVTFHCFVAPFLQALAGGGVAMPRFAQATLDADAEGRPGLMRLLPGLLSGDVLKQTVRLVEWQGSGDLAANARANCYVVLSDERAAFKAGDTVPIMLR